MTAFNEYDNTLNHPLYTATLTHLDHLNRSQGPSPEGDDQVPNPYMSLRKKP